MVRAVPELDTRSPQRHIRAPEGAHQGAVLAIHTGTSRDGSHPAAVHEKMRDLGPPDQRSPRFH